MQVIYKPGPGNSPTRPASMRIPGQGPKDFWPGVPEEFGDKAHARYCYRNANFFPPVPAKVYYSAEVAARFQRGDFVVAFGSPAEPGIPGATVRVERLDLQPLLGKTVGITSATAVSPDACFLITVDPDIARRLLRDDRFDIEPFTVLTEEEQTETSGPSLADAMAELNAAPTPPPSTDEAPPAEAPDESDEAPKKRRGGK